MAQPTKSDTKARAQQQRRARLAAELRSNLSKRKEQARSRALRNAPEAEQAATEPLGREAPAKDAAAPTRDGA
jgi:hypothetical protein